jgi:uncharacterized membrane protein YoaK (UPF0700 family)
MPLRRLTARDRSSAANWQLASLLAFTAGTVDVSGYLALHQSTSHMSGLVSGLALDFAHQGARILIRPLAVLICFLAGAAFCALLVNWELRRKREGVFALPVLVEALLLASIALPWATRHPLLTLSCMGFAMGLQNAIITKISHAEIRTTHITGMVTDIGIELGKALYWNRSVGHPAVTANRKRLLLLTTLVVLFFGGGTLGALAYPHVRLLLMLPLAATLALLTLLPLAADLRTLKSGY